MNYNWTIVLFKSELSLCRAYSNVASSQLLMTFVGLSQRAVDITSWPSVRIDSRDLAILKSKPKLILALSGFLYICRKALSFDASIKCPAYPLKGLGFKCLPITLLSRGRRLHLSVTLCIDCWI